MTRSLSGTGWPKATAELSGSLELSSLLELASLEELSDWLELLERSLG